MSNKLWLQLSVYFPLLKSQWLHLVCVHVVLCIYVYERRHFNWNRIFFYLCANWVYRLYKRARLSRKHKNGETYIAGSVCAVMCKPMRVKIIRKSKKTSIMEMVGVGDVEKKRICKRTEFSSYKHSPISIPSYTSRTCKHKHNHPIFTKRICLLISTHKVNPHNNLKIEHIFTILYLHPSYFMWTLGRGSLALAATYIIA